MILCRCQHEGAIPSSSLNDNGQLSVFSGTTFPGRKIYYNSEAEQVLTVKDNPFFGLTLALAFSHMGTVIGNGILGGSLYILPTEPSAIRFFST